MPNNDLLRQERLSRGWSQADVAEKIGSDPKTVGRWERGLTSPGPYLCQQLCQLYGKTPLELGLRTKDEAEGLPTTAVSTLVAPTEERPPAANAQPPARENKRWRERRPLWLGILAACALVVILGGWLGTRLLTPAPASSHSSLDPYVGKGTLAMSAPLNASEVGWPTDELPQGTCSFTSGAYQILGTQAEYMRVCLADGTDFQNFVFEVQLQIDAGDCGGLAFRSHFPLLYYFVVCSDGHYRFVRYDKDIVANRRIIDQGISPALHTGYNQSNTIAAVADGSAFKLYINHTLIGQGIDGAYIDGQLGLMVHTCRVTYLDPRPDLCTAPTQVLFRDVRVWKL